MAASDFLFWGIWGLILVVAGLLTLYLRMRTDAALARLLSEVAIIAFAFFCYFFVRGLVAGRDAEAVRRAERLIDFEQAAGFFWEPAWQDAIIDSDVIVTLSNWVYMWGHWPVILFAAVWLFFYHRSTYGLFRTAFVVSGAIGLMIFLLFPTAPPRLVDGYGFVDTIAERSASYRVLQPPAFVNQYAAMPSLHFGWNLLIGIALFSRATHPAARCFGALMPAAMFVSMVFTANHFFSDALAGGSLALAALGVALLLRRWSALGYRSALHKLG